MNRELMHVIDQISFERGIDRAEVIQALETALLSASRKRLGEEGHLEVRLNETTGDLDILVAKTVVARPSDTLAEISLPAARAIDPAARGWSGD